MANDYYIADDEDRANEEEYARMYEEYMWEKAMKEQESHNEFMRTCADMRRKEIKESRP